MIRRKECLVVMIAAILLGFLAGMLIQSVKAHPPCNEQAPRCGYVQVVNPITGKLEQQYVCQ